MDLDAIQQGYACKTNDELLALASDRYGLEREARWALLEELSRRKLAYPPRPSRIELLGQANPAVSTAVTIAVALLCVLFMVVAVLVAAAFDPHRRFRLIFYTLLVLGSLFGAIAWVTHRALRGLSTAKKLLSAQNK